MPAHRDPIEIIIPPPTLGTVLPAPTNLRVDNQSAASTINLSWDAVAGAVGYDIYINGVYTGSSPGPGAVFNGRGHGSCQGIIAPGQTYTLTVRAKDSAGTSSADSNTVNWTSDPTPFAATGAKTIAVALVKFADYGINGSPLTPASVLSALNGPDVVNLAQYISDCSRTLMTMTATVFGWLTMPQPITYYINKATVDGRNPHQIGGTGPWYGISDTFMPDLLALLNATYGIANFNMNAAFIEGMGEAGFSGNPIIGTGDTTTTVMLATLAHEAGHTFGDMKHAGDHQPLLSGIPVVGPDLLGQQTGGYQLGRYSDPYDPMGAYLNDQYSVYHKLLAGWLPNSEIKVTSIGATVDLADGTNPALQAPTKYHGLWVMIQPTGFFYIVEVRGTNMRVYLHSLQFYTGGTSDNDHYLMRRYPAVPQFGVGETFDDPYRGVQIQNSATVSGAQRIIVTYYTPGAPPKRVTWHPSADLVTGWVKTPSTALRHYLLLNGDPLASDDSATEISSVVVGQKDRFRLGIVPADFVSQTSLQLGIRCRGAEHLGIEDTFTATLYVNGVAQTPLTLSIGLLAQGQWTSFTFDAIATLVAGATVDIELESSIIFSKVEISDFNVFLMYL